MLVSVMLANNEVGTINPVREIGEICRAAGVWLHCDTRPGGPARFPSMLNSLRPDLISVSALSVYGPKESGRLVMANHGARIRIEPLFDGGGHRRPPALERCRSPLIVGFGVACRLAREQLPEEATRLAALRDRLWTGLAQQLEGLSVNGHPTDRLPGNLNISFDGVDGEALMMKLTDIAVSSG